MRVPYAVRIASQSRAGFRPDQPHLATRRFVESPGMHEDDTDIVPPGVRQYENVVPRTLLDQINAAIDETRDTWQPADGRRATQTTARVVELLRQGGAFQRVERQARATSQRWA